MRFEDIQALLQPILPANLRTLYDQFLQESGSNDSDEFLAWLHANGWIDHQRFVQLLRWGELSLSTVVGMSGRIVADPDKVAPGRKGLPQLHCASTASDHYAMLGPIGEGAMGKVVVAKDLDLFRKVAFKEMTFDLARNETLVGRFLREAQITAQLDHPNIVPIYGLELTEEQSLGYAMKLIHGKDLEQLIAEKQALYDRGAPIDAEHSLETLLGHFLRVCDALGYAHSRGVVHRDLKPANIMIGAYNEVYLMDWGVARLFRDPGTGIDATLHGSIEEEAGDYTVTGQAIGTPAYMSPEQADGRNEQLDGRSDVYSMGLVLYELVSLNRAVTGKTMFERLARAIDGEKDPLVHYAGEKIPFELAAIVDKATKHRPHHRYRDIETFAADIRRYLRGEAVQARPDPPLRKLTRWASRHGTGLLVAVLLVLVGASLLFTGAVVQHFMVKDALRQQAEAREEQLASLQAAVGWQRHLLDQEILHYESLLNGLAGASVQALTGPLPPWQRVHLSEWYDNPAQAPPDLAPSGRYRTEISLATPVFKLAPGVALREVHPLLRRMVQLSDQFRRTALGSHSDEALDLDLEGQWQLLGETGVPLVWMYVGLEQGVHTSYPGHTGYSPDYDPRQRPWYQQAVGRKGLIWGKPYVDASGHGLVLACSTALYDADNEVLGVAGVDITLDYVIDELLDLTGDYGEHEVFLVDEEGLIVARSSDRGREIDANAPWVQHPFPIPGAFSTIKERESGHLEIAAAERSVLIVYSRLMSLGWYYVIAGETEDLIQL